MTTCTGCSRAGEDPGRASTTSSGGSSGCRGRRSGCGGRGIPRVEYPAFQQYPEFKGVFVGGCVDRGDGSSFRAKAHTQEPHKGWICVRSAKRLYVPGTNRPSKLMLHELAHILTGHGHDDTWRKEVRRLGGAINHWETKAWHRQRRGIMTETTTSEDTMTPEQRKELRKKNQEHLAKKRAMRERVTAVKKGRKQPVEAAATEPTAEQQAPERVPEAPSKAPEAPEAQKRESLNALKARVKETWPKAKYMADAKREELVALLERGDAEIFTQYQETWAKRSKVRYEAWLKGDSKSAQAARAKQAA